MDTAKSLALEWNRLTAEIAQAKAHNRDPMRKAVDLQPLYYARLNVGERMASTILAG
jgi:hypothetical protein